MAKTMYTGMVNSPTTKLNRDIGPTDTIIPVENLDVFPPAPNIAVLGIDESAETILYAAIDTAASTLTGCTRALEGVAKTWPSTTPIARNFTNYDYTALIENVVNALSRDGGIVKGNLSVNGDTTLGKTSVYDVLELNSEPTENAHAATKQYVDGETAKRLPKSGGTITGDLIVEGNATFRGMQTSQPLKLYYEPTLENHAVGKKYVDDVKTVAAAANATANTALTKANAALPKTGGTMTGPLISEMSITGKGLFMSGENLGTTVQMGVSPQSISMGLISGSRITTTGLQGRIDRDNQKIVITYEGNPTEPKEIATKQYVDAETAKYLPLTGGTVQGETVFVSPYAGYVISTPDGLVNYSKWMEMRVAMRNFEPSILIVKCDSNPNVEEEILAEWK